MIEIYLDECNKISENKKNCFDKLVPDDYHSSARFKELHGAHSTLRLEGQEEQIKEGTVIKLWALNKPLNRTLVL